MLVADSSIPAEWFAQGDLDLQAVEILLAQNGPPSVAAFLLQQAIEKYLKGYLLSTGWSLRRIHDLEMLTQEAISREPAFAPFLEFCRKISEYYIESRYPIGVTTPLEYHSLRDDFRIAGTLIALIRRKTNHKNDRSV